MQLVLSEMDFTRGAIANALAEGMTLEDLWMCAEHAQTGQDFDDAVNLLAQTMQEPRPNLLGRLRWAVLYVIGAK